jgi:hypothetical protein
MKDMQAQLERHEQTPTMDHTRNRTIHSEPGNPRGDKPDTPGVRRLR